MFEQVNADWDKPKQFMQIINLKRFHAVNLLYFVNRNIRLKDISATSLECKSNDWFLCSVSNTTLGGNELKSMFFTKFFRYIYKVNLCAYSANIYLYKVNNTNTKKGVKYAQC